MTTALETRPPAEASPAALVAALVSASMDAETLQPEAPAGQIEVPAERWTINDAGRANWYLRNLRIIEDEIATVKAQAAEMIRGLEADRNRLNARHEADFQAWAKEELTRRKNGKKTLPLLQGTVSFRTVPGSLRVSAPTDAIEYARAQGWEIVKTVESIDADAYKREAAAAMQETGEVLPGIEVVAERESVSIKFGKKGGESEE